MRVIITQEFPVSSNYWLIWNNSNPWAFKFFLTKTVNQNTSISNPLPYFESQYFWSIRSSCLWLLFLFFIHSLIPIGFPIVLLDECIIGKNACVSCRKCDQNLIQSVLRGKGGSPLKSPIFHNLSDWYTMTRRKQWATNVYHVIGRSHINQQIFEIKHHFDYAIYSIVKTCSFEN